MKTAGRTSEVEYELKAITPEAIPAAIAKAERYRLLNEPRDAESICRDVLRVDSDHQDAIRILLLALTDQFRHGVNVNIGHAQELVPRLSDEYAREYYTGVICERWAKSQLLQDAAPGYVIFDWLSQAMAHYALAEAQRAAGNDDPILRWNACARIIRRHEHVRPRVENAPDEILQDDVPVY